MPRYTRKPPKRGLKSSAPKRTSSNRRPVSSAPRKKASYAPAPTTKAPTGRTAAPARTTFRRPVRGGSRWGMWFKMLRAYYIKYTPRFIAGFVVLGVLLLTGAFFIFFFEDGKPTFAKAAIPSPSPSAMLTEADDPFQGQYTAEELEGLAGSGLDLTSEGYADILDQDRVSIGVFIGSVDPAEEMMLKKLDEAIDAEYASGTVAGVQKYYSTNNFNEQIQGIRSLANNDAKAVVVAIKDEAEYTAIVDMAKNAGMKVVAVNAPVDYGYDINIVADGTEFGTANASFVGNNLSGRNNVAQFVDTSEEAANDKRLEAFNTKISEYDQINILPVVDVSSGTSVGRGMDNLLDDATIEAIYTENGLALDVLDECIENQRFPKVFIGDATAGFINRWYELATTGISAEVKIDPDDDDSETRTIKVQAPGMLVYVRPTPYGTAATAVKFAIRLAEGKALKTDMLTDNRVYYYTGTVAITDAVLPYYYEQVKDKDDDFVVNDWPSDYEVDLYFLNTGSSYYQQASDEEVANVEAAPEITPDDTAQSSPSPAASQAN